MIEWIDVNAELPEPNQPVQVFTTDFNGGYCFGCHCHNGYGWKTLHWREGWQDMSLGGGNKPTHWQPLPEPLETFHYE